MPMPSVEPMPDSLPRDDRFSVPEDAQEASYFAASARISSFRIRSMFANRLWSQEMAIRPSGRNPGRVRPCRPGAASRYPNVSGDSEFTPAS